MYVNGYVSDYNIISGQVTEKQKTRVSCEHDYECNCRTECSGSGESKSCSRVCDTCYEHSNDWDWDVHSTIGTFTIGRVDRRGSHEPPRWTKVYKGEPVNKEVYFKNWLLADKDNLFVETKTAITYSHPGYPRIHDYYRVNRIYGNPITVARNELESFLSEFLKTRGSKNIVVYFTEYPEHFFYSLMASWNGGKQNDYILVYGLDKSGTINWFKSNSYARGMDNRHTHNSLEQKSIGKIFSMELFTETVNIVNNNFVLVDPEQFKFKRDSIEIPLSLMLAIFIMNLMTSIGLAIYMRKNRL